MRTPVFNFKLFKDDFSEKFDVSESKFVRVIFELLDFFSKDKRFMIIVWEYNGPRTMLMIYIHLFTVLTF